MGNYPEIYGNHSPEKQNSRDKNTGGKKRDAGKTGSIEKQYDAKSQRTVFAPSRPNKRSCKKIAETDAELIQIANRLGGGYQPLNAVPEEAEEELKIPDDEEIDKEQNPVDTEEDSVIMRGDKMPIVARENTTQTVKKLTIYRSTI